MVKTTTVGQRFSELIQALGMSKNAFALSLDKTATVIQHIVDERNKPGFDLLCKVFDVYPNVSKEWILQGIGQMYNDADETLGVASTGSAAPMPVLTSAVGDTAARLAEELPAAPVAAPLPVTAEARVPVVPAAAPTPVPVAEAPAVAAPLLPSRAETPAPAVAAPLPTPNWEAALYAQQLQHQLALAELRNQHLLEQQKMLQQMVELLRQPR